MVDVARKRRARRALAWLVAVLLVCFGAWGVFRGTTDDGGGSGGTGRVVLDGSSASFTISGNATAPLSPGVQAALDLVLTNPHDVAVSVDTLRVTVQAVSAPNADEGYPCAARDFALDQASSGLVVRLPPHSTSSLSSLGVPAASQPQVGMVNRAVDQGGCKGASLTLAYTAFGRAAA
jgi:hypothetical protein